MAEKPSDGEAKGQGWWDSIPGMLKAVAGVVTAVTGLLVVFHQLGWLGRGADAEPAAMEPHSAGAAAAPPGQALESAGGYRVTFPAGSAVSLRSVRAEGRYEILSATAEARGGGRYQLKLSVRLTSAGPMDLGFYTDSFRLLVDGVPRAPVNSLIEAVDARSSKEADILFDLPTAATRLELEIANGEDSATLPISLARTG